VCYRLRVVRLLLSAVVLYSSLTAIAYALLLRWSTKWKSSGFRLRDSAGRTVNTNRSDFCDPKTFDTTVLHTAHMQPDVLSCSGTSIVLG
jgi:hypothetical protein